MTRSRLRFTKSGRRPWLLTVAWLCALLHAGAGASQGSLDAAPAPGPAAQDPVEPASPEAPPAEPASKEAPPAVVDDTTLEQQRSAVQALNEHFLGSAARAVRFDWRRATATFGLLGGELLERNNFGAFRVGIFGRHAFGDLLLDVAVNYGITSSTRSSEILALTPYRQYGRPSRFELDVNVGYAIVEGVVTPLAGFLPPTEMVLVALGGVRYLVYIEGLLGRPLTDVGLDLVSPQISAGERTRIEPSAPGGMLIDAARFHPLVGLSLEVYVQPGFFVAPRAMLALPLLAPITGTGLGYWWELSLAIGYAL